MRWVIRWVFALASGLSLLVFVASMVLWVRSFWQVDVADWSYHDASGDLHERSLKSDRGRIWCEASSRSGEFPGAMIDADPPTGLTSRPPDAGDSADALEWAAPHGSLGVRYGVSTFTTPSTTHTAGTVVFPLGYVAGLAAVLPAAHLASAVRRKHHIGRCPACGYDMTGNVSGVCPECGTPVKPAKDEATGAA